MNSILKRILSLKKEEYSAFVDKRIESLSKATSFCPRVKNGQFEKCNKFFGKNSLIVAGHSYLLLDDDSVFNILIDNLKKMFKGYKFNNNKEINKIIREAVQKSVFDYYGIGKTDEQERDCVYRRSFEKDEYTSVSEFKNTCNSACLERSALAHNFFKFLGIESLIISDLISLNNNGNELHTLNIIREDGNDYIYDLINTYWDKEAPAPEIIHEKIEGEHDLFNNQDYCSFPYLKEIFVKTQSGKTVRISYGGCYKELEKC